MSYREYLREYSLLVEEVFKPIWLTYYGVGGCLKRFQKIENKALFTSVVFLDTFFHTALHTYARDLKNIFIKRRVIHIDMMTGACGTITFYRPYVMLGMHRHWSDEDLKILKETMLEYLNDVQIDLKIHNYDSKKFFGDISRDSSLQLYSSNNPDLNFECSLGMVVDERAYNVYKETLLSFIK